LKGNIITRIIIIAVITVFAGIFLVPSVTWWGLSREKKALWESSLVMAPVAPTNAVSTNLARPPAARTNAAAASNAVAGASTNDVNAMIEQQREIDKLRVLKAKVVKLGLDLQGGMQIVLQADLSQFKGQKDREDAINRALEIVRNRIDQFGVSEPGINRQGDDRVVVQLPGVRDPKRAQELLRAEGSLEFKLVNDEMSKPENFADYKKGILKPGVALAEDEEILFLWSKNPDTGKMEQGTPVVLKKNPPVTGKALKTAQVGFSQFQEPEVEFEMKADGAKLFYEFTSVNVGKRLAIVLDNKVRSAPTIRDKLSDRGVITGSFSIDEAKDLALILRAGALPVKMEIVEQRVVGPSLGKDSIDAGVKAGWIAVILIFGFMTLYYRLSGLVAVFATVLNMFITIGILTGLGFTLTLPGIAGLILTVGMAVDANVIIFERIREELRAGKTPVAAIEAGYDRAFVTVLDSNLTTMIIAAILFQFGTGSIKGFAATLFIGIGANLFTGVYVTRTAFMYIAQKFGIRRLSI
jgi:preprotein translocase subunit SecD